MQQRSKKSGSTFRDDFRPWGHRRIATFRFPLVSMRGFNLIEMVIVIVLVGIVFSIGGILLNQVFKSYFTEQDVSEADWQAKVALERAARELRAIRSASAADLDIASASQIRFIDSDGNGICYYRDAVNNRFMRSADGPATACNTTSPQPLADNINSLTFTYWTNTVAPVASAASVSSVYYIAVAMSVARGDYSGGFRANVRPRNF